MPRVGRNDTTSSRSVGTDMDIRVTVKRGGEFVQRRIESVLEESSGTPHERFEELSGLGDHLSQMAGAKLDRTTRILEENRGSMTGEQLGAVAVLHADIRELNEVIRRICHEMRKINNHVREHGNCWDNWE